MSFSGKYQFKTRAEKPVRIAFLYSKLTETDELLEYTSPVRSWRRMKPIYPVVANAKDSFYCHEMPDNCGNYATLSDCLIRKLDSKYAPQSGSDAGTTNDGDVVFAVFSVGTSAFVPEYVSFYQDFSISFLTSTGIGADQRGGFYGVYGDPGNGTTVGFIPSISIETSVLFRGLNIPPTLSGCAVGFNVQSKRWNISAYSAGDYYKYNGEWDTENVEEFYTTPHPEHTTDPSSFFGGGYTLISYGCQVGHRAINAACNDTIKPEDWFLSGLGNMSGSILEQQVKKETADFRRGTGYVVFAGSKNQLSDFAELLNQATIFWDLEPGVQLQVVANPFGCSTTGDLNGGGLPDDPDPEVIPPVTSATYHGRYSEIFVNFQGDGQVKEVKLPIRFPTRATKVQYGNTAFYNKNISPISGLQPVVAEWTSELFKGVLELDSDYIYAKILYAPFREWKAGEKPYAVVAFHENTYSHNNFEWTIETRKLTYPQATGAYLDATGYVVPQVDWFNKCRVFKIRQSDMTIVEDVTYSRGANQVISQDGWTHEITKDYVLLDHRTEAKEMFFIGADNVLVPPNLVVPPTTGKRGYCGTPIIYPQIGLGVDIRDGKNLAPYTFPDFLTPQESWTDLDWVIYLLSEKPSNYFVDYTGRMGVDDRVKNLYFNTPGKFSGYGRTPKHQSNLYIQPVQGQINDYTDIESGDGFMDKIVEYNCFLGSAIKKDGVIKKWVRVSPNSFPIPYIRRIET